MPYFKRQHHKDAEGRESYVYHPTVMKKDKDTVFIKNRNHDKTFIRRINVKKHNRVNKSENKKAGYISTKKKPSVVSVKSHTRSRPKRRK